MKSSRCRSALYWLIRDSYLSIRTRLCTSS
nr:MAG TPA: hypothetical protein [Caudoviricetes sp.]